MNYDIKKDVKPIETIEKIKTILKENGIKITCNPSGMGRSYCSYRVRFLKYNIGANGKGTNQINAQASSYAEFLERLQTQYLVDFKNIEDYKITDEKIKNILYFKKESSIDFLKKYDVEINKINEAYNNSLIKKIEKNKVVTLPFVSCVKRKVVFIPEFALIFQGTNGLAAGNTYEEACVQALSEIIERNCLKNVFKNKIKLPIIPKEIYQKYDELARLIDEIERLGYKITVKDASLNQKFPTVCCIFKDLKYPKNGISCNFGTHPYFPIALERCLTEFMQGYGFLFHNREEFKIFVQKSDVTLEKLIEESYIRRTFIDKSNKYIQHFLSKESDYEFDKNVWLFDEEVDNKTMFDNLSQLVLKYCDDIYIRNCSFLGFPTVQVFAPEISIPRIINNNYFKNLINSINIKIYKKELEKYFNLEDIIGVCEFIYLQNYDPTKIQRLIEGLESEYVAFYCSICLKNKRNIKRYLRKIIKNQITIDKNNNPMLRLYQGFGKYFKLSWAKIDELKIKEIIEKQYSLEIYQEIIKTLETINEETIFNLIKFHLAQEEEMGEKQLKEELKNKLYEAYKANPPNQNEIIKIINKPNIFKKILNKLCLRQKFKL